MSGFLSTDELLEIVKNEVTLNCKLPFTLDYNNIKRIISRASLWFYKNYFYANQRTFYYVDMMSLYKNISTDVKYIQLPPEIEAVNWVHLVNYNDMRNLGYILPTSGMSLGPTATPFVASINVSDFAQSMSVMQTLADTLSSFTKTTVRNQFNPNSKRFEIQTRLKNNLILDVYAHIPLEALYNDINFQEYVIGEALMDTSIHLSYIQTQFAGNTQISTDRLFTKGEKMKNDVIEKINAMNKTSSFFINKTN